MDIENKIISRPAALRRICSKLRSSGKKIVLTTGAYDIIHDGHPLYLQAAKKLGDILVVGVNSNKSVSRLKGKKRPILSGGVRLRIVAAFGSVDYACIFCDDERIADIVRPDVLVMSETSENGKKERAGQVSIVEKYEGTVVVLPPMSGIHTSDIIKKIKNNL